MLDTLYRCDGCKDPLATKRHISLMLTGNAYPYSGVANPPTKKNKRWQIKPELFGKFLHFHNGDCAKTFFDQLLESK